MRIRTAPPILWQGHIVGEVSCPTRYGDDASSISFARSVRYGLGCLLTSVQFFLARRNWIRLERFSGVCRAPVSTS